MYHFSNTSIQKLDTCDAHIILVANHVIRHFDFTVIWGYRGEEDQNECFANGTSTKQFPDSFHNVYPSKAIDIVPWPIDWDDLDRFYYLAGLWRGYGKALGIEFIWGNDWNNNNIFTREPGDILDDMGHLQLA